MSIIKNYIINEAIVGFNIEQRKDIYSILLADIAQQGLDLEFITTTSEPTEQPQPQEGPQIVFENIVENTTRTVTTAAPVEITQTTLGQTVQSNENIQTEDLFQQSRVERSTAEVVEALKNFAVRRNVQRAANFASTATRTNRGNNR